jgi:Fe-S cluster assembly protein SufD
MADVGTVDTAKEQYLAAFARLEKECPGWKRSWTSALRRAALSRFAEIGFPTLQQEEWRKTGVAPILKVPFRPEPVYTTNGFTPQVIERYTFEPWDCTHLVFINGHYAPELSRLRPLPAGVAIEPLSAALETRRDEIEPHLARHAGMAQHAFAALNTAFMQDGVFVRIPDGVGIDEPIHLLFISTSGGGPVVSYPRNLIVAGKGSRAALVESYVGPRHDRYFTDAVTEIVAGENAAIDHYKLQRESERAFHVALVQADLGRYARLASWNISLGGELVRNDTRALLGGDGGEVRLDGLYITGGAQHVDNHTLIDHASPHGTSHELYKGVLDDRSRGVFDGTIIVRQDAQKSDARQTNRNLLVSEEALVDTTPRLQILADDVKCTHGATIGQIDEDAMFYLRSRAVSQEAARNLLIQAFVSEILHGMRIEPLRAGLECLLFTRLHRGHGAGVEP